VYHFFKKIVKINVQLQNHTIGKKKTNSISILLPPWRK